MTAGWVSVDGCRLSYDVAGAPEAPVLLLVHSLGTTRALWEPQVEPLGRRFRVVRYDTRGHGASQTPAGDYSLERLARDALGVLDAVGASRSHVCGVSLGGLVTLWLGIHAPDRVERLVAANTAAQLGRPELWQQRIDLIRSEGLAPVVETGLARWFTDGFRRTETQIATRFRTMLAGCAVDGYAGSCAALRDADLRPDLGRIRAPLLVVTGRHDQATPPADGRRIHEGVAGSRYVALDAAHLANIEQPDAFSSEVARFLTSGAPTG